MAPPRVIAAWRLLIAEVVLVVILLALRAMLDPVPYVALAYRWCTLALFALAFVRRELLWGYGASDWAIFARLSAGPMLLGHTGMNRPLRHLPTHVVDLTVLGEPVGASLLAMLIPAIGERPDGWSVAGGALILGGIRALRTPRESEAA